VLNGIETALSDGKCMNTVEIIGLTMLGMVAIAGVSLSIYSALPHELLQMASDHGRYTGLGTRDRVNDTSGNSPVADVGSLQGQSA
jgi:hypothetical protein